MTPRPLAWAVRAPTYSKAAAAFLLALASALAGLAVLGLAFWVAHQPYEDCLGAAVGSRTRACVQEAYWAIRAPLLASVPFVLAAGLLSLCACVAVPALVVAAHRRRRRDEADLRRIDRLEDARARGALSEVTFVALAGRLRERVQTGSPAAVAEDAARLGLLLLGIALPLYLVLVAFLAFVGVQPWNNSPHAIVPLAVPLGVGAGLAAALLLGWAWWRADRAAEGALERETRALDAEWDEALAEAHAASRPDEPTGVSR